MAAPIEWNKVLIEESNWITYVGIACYWKEWQMDNAKWYLTSADTAKEIWQIRKIETADGTTEISYPNGDTWNNYAWDDREDLDYA